MRKSSSPELTALQTLNSFNLFSSCQHFPLLYIYWISQNLNIFPLNALTKQGVRISPSVAATVRPRLVTSGSARWECSPSDRCLSASKLGSSGATAPVTRRARDMHSARWAQTCQTVTGLCRGCVCWMGNSCLPVSCCWPVR